mmetsp:Transcript_49499/g.130566  ORF Transcript_49499/g.130566 Transcript_49499/m.130566 type:complete len:336 (+) Transcript_49499:68-1075(+)
MTDAVLGHFEDAFDPCDLRENSVLTLRLPDTLWCSTILVPLLNFGSISPGFWFQLMMVWLPQYGALLVSVCIQSILIAYLRQATLDQLQTRDACPDDVSYLRFVAICVLTMWVLATEGMQIFATLRWLAAIPSWQPVRHEQILTAVRSRQQRAQPIRLALHVYHQRASAGPQRKFTMFATGITRKYRTFVFLLLIIPRFLLGSACLYYSAGFITLAETIQDLILNALATAFIMEVDDTLFNLFTSGVVQRMVSNFPDIGIPRAKSTILDWSIESARFPIVFLMQVLITAAVAESWCGSPMVSYVATSLILILCVLLGMCGCMSAAGGRKMPIPKE